MPQPYIYIHTHKNWFIFNKNLSLLEPSSLCDFLSLFSYGLTGWVSSSSSPSLESKPSLSDLLESCKASIIGNLELTEIYRFAHLQTKERQRSLWWRPSRLYVRVSRWYVNLKPFSSHGAGAWEPSLTIRDFVEDNFEDQEIVWLGRKRNWWSKGIFIIPIWISKPTG